MFKGLRQKIHQNLASTHTTNTTILSHEMVDETLLPFSVHPSGQNDSTACTGSDGTSASTPSDSLINLDDGPTDYISLQEGTCTMTDLSKDFSEAAILDISRSISPTLDLRFPSLDMHSRTSSLSSEAGDNSSVAVPSCHISLPSDVEKEVEVGGLALSNITKEVLYGHLCHVLQKSNKYRSKFSQVSKAYHEIEKERDKLADTMTKSQDKAFRRISELKEQSELDQLAKIDLEQNYTLMLEEKDEQIKVLRTQIVLLKQGKEIPEEMMTRVDTNIKNDGFGMTSGQSEMHLKEKVTRMSSLLLASKESIGKYQAFVQKLTLENAQLRKSLEKKDQDSEMLAEKLKEEHLKILLNHDVNLNDLVENRCGPLEQIEVLCSSTLSQLLAARERFKELSELLNNTETNNKKIVLEKEILMEELAELKCALHKIKSIGLSSENVSPGVHTVVRNWKSDCEMHHVEVCVNEKQLEVFKEIVVDLARVGNSQHFESLKLRGGSDLDLEHHDLTCVTCEKESQVMLANERNPHYREHFQKTEEIMNELTQQCKKGNIGEDVTDGAENQSLDMQMEFYEKKRCLTAAEVVGENPSLQKIDLEENPKLTSLHQMEPQTELSELQNSIQADSDLLSGKDLKEQVVLLEKELLKQQEANCLLEKDKEMLRDELNAQQESYIAKILAAKQENQVLEEFLAAAERSQQVSVTLQDIQSLEALSLSGTTEESEETVQKVLSLGRSSTVDSNLIVGNQLEECDKGHETKDWNLIDRNMLTGIQIKELQNKNDCLHRLLHDWQGCVQMLKDCLENKDLEKQLLDTQLQQAKRFFGSLWTQLEEADKKWVQQMDDVKQYHGEEMNNFTKEMKNLVRKGELFELQTNHADERLTLESEITNLRNCIVSLEDKNRQLASQLQNAENKTENLIFAAHDLKNMKDSEEELLKQNLKSSVQVVEAELYEHTALNSDLEKLQLRDMKKNSRIKFESLNTANLSNSPKEVTVAEENLLTQVNDYKEGLKTGSDSKKNFFNFQLDQLNELKQVCVGLQEDKILLHQKLLTAESYCSAAEIEPEELKCQIHTLQNQLKKSYEESNDHRKQLQCVEEQLNTLKKELTDLKDNNIMCCRQLIEFKECNECINNKLLESKWQNEALSEQVKILEEMRDIVYRELIEFRVQKESHQIVIEELTEQRGVSKEEFLQDKGHDKSLQIHLEGSKSISLSDGSLNSVMQGKSLMLEETESLNRLHSLEGIHKIQLNVLVMNIHSIKSELEAAKAEAVTLRDRVRYQDEMLEIQEGTVRLLTNEKSQKDTRLMDLEKRLMMVDTSTAVELFELRNKLQLFLNPTTVLEDIRGCQMDELDALKKVLEIELSLYLTKLNTRLNEEQTQNTQLEERVKELTEVLYKTEKKLLEEKMILHCEQEEWENRNMEHKKKTEKLEALVQEFHNKIYSIQTECDKTVNDKEELLTEAEEKLKILEEEQNLRRTEYLTKCLELQERVSYLSEKCSKLEFSAIECRVQKKALEQRVSEFKELQTDNKSNQRNIELDLLDKSAEHDAEKCRLMVLNDELTERTSSISNKASKDEIITDKNLKFYGDENDGEMKPLQLDFKELHKELSAKMEEIVQFENTIATKNLHIMELEESLRMRTENNKSEAELSSARLKELQSIQTHRAFEKVREELMLEYNVKMNDHNDVYEMQVKQLTAVIVSHEDKIMAILSGSILEGEMMMKDILANDKLKFQNIGQIRELSTKLAYLAEKLELVKVEYQTNSDIIMILRNTEGDNEVLLNKLNKKLQKKMMKLQLLVSDLESKIHLDENVQTVREDLQVEKQEQDSNVDILKFENKEQRQVIDRLKVENADCYRKIDKLTNTITELETGRVQLYQQINKVLDEKEQAKKDVEEQMLPSGKSEIQRPEEHSTELECMETRYREKVKQVMRKFVIKLKSVQDEHEKLLSEVRAENEELHLTEISLRRQIRDLEAAGEQCQRIADELKERMHEVEKSHMELAEKQTQPMKDVDTAHKEKLENTVVILREQVQQELLEKREEQLKLEKVKEVVMDLNDRITMLSREIEELKEKHTEELRVQAERLQAECSKKLVEFKKKAEVRLKQIKKQMQEEKDASVAELMQVQSSLTSQVMQGKGELERLADFLQQREDKILMLYDAESKWKDEICALQTETEKTKEINKKLEQEATTLRQTIQSLEEGSQEKSDKISELEEICKGLKKQLIHAKHEIDQTKSKNDVELKTLRLENEKELLRLTSEYKEKLSDFEMDNNARIKQLVKEFQLKMAEKENEFQVTYMEALEKSQREEDLMIHQHKQEVKALRLEMREKEESFEETVQQLETQLQASEVQLEEEHNKSRLQAEYLKQGLEQLEKELLEYRISKASTSDEYRDTKDYDIQLPSEQLVSSELEGNMCSDISPLALTQISQCTEFQYLKNVLFKFMTGTEKLILARVICMVLKFSDEETQAVLDHQNEKTQLSSID